MHTPDATHPGPRVRERLALLLVLILSAAWVLAGTEPAHSRGDTMNSRLATVYALTEYGSFTLTPPEGAAGNPFADATIDKVKANGRLLSSKPPVLPLLMTGEYVLLRAALGWDLNDPEATARLRRVMTVTFAGVPYVAGLWLFWCALTHLVAAPAARVFLTGALAFGTQFGAYAAVFNNHVPGAFCVIAAVYCALRIVDRPSKGQRVWFALFGVASGFTATIDVPMAIFPFLFGLVLFWRSPRQTLAWAAPAALVPLAVQTVVYLATTGSPLPVQLHPEWYLYEGSYWRNPRGVDALNEPFGTYLFHMTLGRVGLFSLFPVTVLGVIGAVRAWADKGDCVRLIERAGAAGFLVLTLYYATSTNNYGGEAYGFRWYIGAAPVLLLMGAPIVARVRRAWHWALLAVLAAVSIWSFWDCAQNPWRANTEWTTAVFGPSL